ncbi:MAG: hypothetical protein J5621_09395 [Paludibacteraceae bacterium]|nr:hypothetical protein [Paludibacteraceae bacterium]
MPRRTIILLNEQRKYRDQCFTFARDLYPDDDERAQDCYEQLAGVFTSTNLEDKLIDSISIGVAI